VVVNVGDNAVITYNPAGDIVKTEYPAEGGNDGVIVTEDGTKYVSSVRSATCQKFFLVRMRK
jgi:hypothetical protein